MPTDTKNNTANASLSGSVSLPAWWLSSDSERITPAKNAPSANETSNAAEEPYAMPSAMASTHSVNSSRVPARVTRISSHGTTRVPTTSASATNNATLPSVTRIASQVFAGVPGACTTLASPPREGASAGSNTSASTMARSSTMSQPTAIFPSEDCSALRSSSARSNTTVLATDSDNPNTRPAPTPQPMKCARP